MSEEPRLEGSLPASRFARVALGPCFAEGAATRVHAALQPALEREVAVKVPRDPAHAPALLREGRALALLEHPAIVPLYDLQVDGALPRLVLKRVEGAPWSELLADPEHAMLADEGADRLAFHLGVLLQACDATAHTHRRGLLCLGLAPERILLGRFREVTLVDFASAVAIDPDLRGWLPMAEEVARPVGRSGRRAPEMDHEDGTLDERTDVYLLGSLLQELLECVVGERSPGDAEPLFDIARRATAEAPDARHPHVEAFREEVEAFLRHRDADALTQEALGRLAQLEKALDEDRLTDARRYFAESCFGFRAALEAWRDDHRAAFGLERALRAMASHLLARQDLAAAEPLLSELGPAGVDLAQRAEEVRQRVAAEEAREASLRRIARERDLTVSGVERARIYFALTALVGLSSVGVGTLQAAGWITVSWVPVFTITFACLVSVIGLSFHWRHALQRNQVGRRLVIAILFLTMNALFQETVLYRAGAEVHHALVTISLACGVGAASLALFAGDRRIHGAAVCLVAAAVGIVLFPAVSTLLIGLALTAAFGWLGYTRMQDARTAPDAP